MIGNKYKVSIAMATFNGSKYIKEQLQSFCTQTLPPQEVVVCDDCSTDNTIKIIEELTHTLPYKVKIIRNSSNVGSTIQDGYGITFSIAAKHCTGDFIFFSDQDDVWYPNKIEQHLKIFESNPNIDFITSRADEVDENLNKINQKSHANCNEFITGKFVRGCCSSGRKSFFQNILPIPKGCSHDWWCTICACSLNKFYETNEKLQAYRIHGKQTSLYYSKNKKSFFQRLQHSIEAYTKDIEYISIKKELKLWNNKLAGFTCFYEKLKKQNLLTDEAYMYFQKINDKYNLLSLRNELRNLSFFKRMKLAKNNFILYKKESDLFRATKYLCKDIFAPSIAKILNNTNSNKG